MAGGSKFGEKALAVRGGPQTLLWPLLFLAVGTASAYVIASYQNASIEEHGRAAVRARLEPMRAELSRELSGAIRLTQGMASLVAVEGESSARSPEGLRLLDPKTVRLSDMARWTVVHCSGRST